ncbi:MAG TPA: hypothetical protein VGD02_08885 [Gemmatimonadaceae bacterium]
MKRPGGVTAAVIVAMFGSMIALMLAAAAVASVFIKLPPGGQAPPPASVLIGAAVFTVVAGVGVWTAVGLFQLRPRARTAIQVLAIFVAIGCAFFLAIFSLVRPAAGLSRDTVNAGRIAVALVSGIPLVIAVWILFQFNTSKTKAAFASGEAVDASPRPLSITFIAWSYLLSIPVFLASTLSDGPGFLLGLTIPTWAARIYAVALAVLSFYIGKGLLELRERTRVIAIGWSVFSLANALVIFLPSVRQRLLNTQPPPGVETALPFSPDTFLNVVYGAFAIGAVLTIWFLEHHRDKFLRAENFRFLVGLHRG